MDEDVRIVTELELRREAEGLDGPKLVVDLQLRGAQLDARTLRRWEERAHKPYPVHGEALCERFDVDSVALLGLGYGPVAARHWTWMTEEERILEVHRRRFCIATATTTGVLLLPVSRLTAAAQLLGGYPRIGAADVTFATEVATNIASSYAATPNAEVVRSAEAHAYTLLDLLKHAEMGEPTETRLRAVASDAASLVGYGHLNAGRLAEAERWFDMALKLARQAGDRRLEALALASSAWIPLYAPEPDRDAVVAALEAAAELQCFLPPAGRAWLFGYLARERAALGDDLDSGRFLERAQAAAARVPRDDPGSGWWSAHGELGGWDSARFEVFTGRRLLWLGRPVDALDLFDGALDGTTAPVRRAGLHQSVMRACVALGDSDRACASAHAVLDEGETHQLGLFPERIRKARATFPRRWNTLTRVIELDERLAFAS